MPAHRLEEGRSDLAVARKESRVQMGTFTGLLASFPPEPNEASLFAEIQQEVARSRRKLVVIDDDPTGTQTVHDIEVFTTWDRQTLASKRQ